MAINVGHHARLLSAYLYVSTYERLAMAVGNSARNACTPFARRLIGSGRGRALALKNNHVVLVNLIADVGLGKQQLKTFLYRRILRL